ncbi:MAG: PepSY domain-containing protein [Gammaproteobacteria bacterium]|nr:PepSY domain-containing protein [Gammaproteobacteria bacterium]MBV8305841.1 PepSY domain-containing protein [Gammaproteobacteria bacterium]MBV8404535.1 PepSY domain-containing protein [Gammaproteobacteria bacterium]
MRSVRFIALLLVCAASAGTGAVFLTASAAPRQPAATAFVMPRDSLSMDQAVRMVEERYHARVVKAQTERDDGRTLYVLRLLNDAGKVWTVRVDAMSGSVQ